MISFTFSSEQFDISLLTQGIVTVGLVSVIAPHSRTTSHPSPLAPTLKQAHPYLIRPHPDPPFPNQPIQPINNLPLTCSYQPIRTFISTHTHKEPWHIIPSYPSQWLPYPALSQGDQYHPIVSRLSHILSMRFYGWPIRLMTCRNYHRPNDPGFQYMAFPNTDVSSYAPAVYVAHLYTSSSDSYRPR